MLMRSKPTALSRQLGVGASAVAHALLGALAVWLSSLPLTSVAADPTRSSARRHDLIWIASAGPGGGGGGGGNRFPDAARARLVGRERITVPANRSSVLAVERPRDSAPSEHLAIPAVPLADAIASLTGVVDSPPSSATTQGPGTGGGAGTGTGTGSGEGRGPGLGPGFGGGTGGEAFRPGSGTTNPRPLREVKPNYTSDAMRAKVQGVVVLECVVLPDGSVGDVKILKSLDSYYGLDAEAIRAARQWRFIPGYRSGQPVPVSVAIELAFTLR